MKTLIAAALFAAGGTALAQTASPALFYSDLTSGPVGSIVTVYGANLGSSVSLNGQNASVVSASSTKISFVVPQTGSGSIVAGKSNSLPFAVRAGHIFYVDKNGSDSASGSASAPWRTIPTAFSKAACGDVVYARDGVAQTSQDDYGAALAVTQRCSDANPLALVGMPGATVTIGNTSLEYGIRNPNLSTNNFNGVVLANLTIRGGNEAIDVAGSQYWRIVGNDIQAPNGSGEAAVVQLEETSNVKLFGNTIHDSGAGGTKYYHSFYATTDSNHIEVGWNTIRDNKSCRGVQFYSTSGSPQYDLSVHDNIIHGQECDGINFSTVDATKGPITAYNNLVYHVGLGGTNDGLPNYSCIASLGYGASGGQMVWSDNTVADCGPAGGSTAGAFTGQSGSPQIVLNGNLVLQNAGEPLYSHDSSTGLFSTNGGYTGLNGTAGVVDGNYQLTAGSPAIGKGMRVQGIAFDLGGKARPQSGGDAGAYLFGSGAAASPAPPPAPAPNPPTPAPAPPAPAPTAIPVQGAITVLFPDGEKDVMNAKFSLTASSSVTSVQSGSVSFVATLPNGKQVTATAPLTFK